LLSQNVLLATRGENAAYVDKFGFYLHDTLESGAGDSAALVSLSKLKFQIIACGTSSACSSGAMYVRAEGRHWSEEEDSARDRTIGVVEDRIDGWSACPVTVDGRRDAKTVSVSPLQLCIIREMSSDGWQGSCDDLVACVEDAVVVAIVDYALEG